MAGILPAADMALALVAGGGTAGHVLPGIAIARALAARGHEVHYVGAERGVEARLVPAAGFPLTLLPGRGIQRKLALANVAAIAGLIGAFFRAIGLVRRLRPNVVVALGGYASVPCAVAAFLWRVPIVVAEQNARPGLANRLVARLAKAAAVSFPGTPLPRAVVTGNPVRPEVLAAAAVDRPRSGRSRVLVFGGSLGALKINQAAVELARRWSDRADVAIHHVVGDRDWDEITATAVPTGALEYRAVRYEDDMPNVLVASDVAVCRAGATTCAELAVVGLPAVLVPSPYVTADHQTANARHLVDAGAAVLVPDAELDAERLATEVDLLIGDPARRAAMTEALHGLARPGAADAVADLVTEHARG